CMEEMTDLHRAHIRLCIDPSESLLNAYPHCNIFRALPTDLPFTPHRLPTDSPPTFCRSGPVSPTSPTTNYIHLEKVVSSSRGGDWISLLSYVSMFLSGHGDCWGDGL